MDLGDRARGHAALGDERRLLIADVLTEGDRTVGELGSLTGLPGNLLAHHLTVLEGAGLVERRVSEGDRRRRYVVLRQSAVAGAVPSTDGLAGSVLFVCSHNSARSQYAAARWQMATGRPAMSVGSTPAARVDPTAVRVAAELGLDLSDAIPRGYSDVTSTVDLLISVCDRAKESPLPASREHRHWSVPDPVAVGSVTAFKAAFAEIDARIERLTTQRPSR